MDWIDEYLVSTENVASPAIFRLWAGISCIAGALEHRVSAKTSMGEIFPNLYVLLVSPPGIGKSEALKPTRELWMGTKHVKVAPNSTTKAALLDVLEASHQIEANNATELNEYHSLSMASSEFGVLLPTHDMEFLSVLTDIYDNPRSFQENRRTSKSVDIINPQLNIIAGTQPGYLASLFPEEAWSMGFMSRVIMVYSGTAPKLDLFGDYSHVTTSALLTGLKQMVSTTAVCGWASSAQAELVRWYESGLQPIPTHSRLANYCARRLVSTIKLSIISTVSRTNGSGNPLVITLTDIDRARNWLLAAETVMPDIFRAMSGKSDMTLLMEMHFYFWRSYTVDKLPIHEAKLLQFISAKTTSERGPRLLAIAVRVNMFAEVGEKLYIPRPHSDFGME
jgi:hypothetical protein